MTEGYTERTSDGYWHFVCPKCHFRFAKEDDELSGPLDCPSCGERLSITGRLLSGGQIRNRTDAGAWAKK